MKNENDGRPHQPGSAAQRPSDFRLAEGLAPLGKGLWNKGWPEMDEAWVSLQSEAPPWAGDRSLPKGQADKAHLA